MITLNGKDEAHTEMLQSGVLRQLLDEKWKTFVRVNTITLLYPCSPLPQI